MANYLKVFNGKLYHCHASSDGIHIYEWIPSDEGVRIRSYPGKFDSGGHFNHVCSRSRPDGSGLLRASANSPVTRAQALSTGDDFVQHGWIATAENIGTTATVTTPSWIIVGMNTKIPYKWGGWNTVAQFDAGIAAGKYA